MLSYQFDTPSQTGMPHLAHGHLANSPAMMRRKSSAPG